MCRDDHIDDFLGWLGVPDPYECPDELYPERVAALLQDYYGAVQQITDERAIMLVDVMRNDIQALLAEAKEHGHLDKWKKCCQGVADYVLRPRTIDGPDRIGVAGAIYQLSGYVHHCVGFFQRFVGPAERIASPIWGAGIIRNEHTGGPVTLDPAKVEPDGRITIRNLAIGRSSRFSRTVYEIKYLASRLLNFLCDAEYPCIWYPLAIKATLLDTIGDSWAVDAKGSDMWTNFAWVDAATVISFLEEQRFDCNRTYVPTVDNRRDWFAHSWVPF